MATLHSLIKLSRWQVDERRRALGLLLAEEERILAQRRSMEEQFHAERAAASADAEVAGYNYAAFARHFVERLAEVDAELAEVRQRLDEARGDLADAYRRQRSYELAQEARDRRERERREKLEQAALDEASLNIHRRRKTPRRA